MTLNLEGQLLFPCLENAAPLLPCFICSCWESRSQSTALSFVTCFRFLPRGSESFFSFSLKSNNSKLIIHAVFLGNPWGPFNVSIRFFISGTFSWITILNALFRYFIFFFGDTKSTRFCPPFARFHFNLILILFLIYFLIFILLVVFLLLLSSLY